MFNLLKLRYKKIPELKLWARDALSRQKETSYIKANDSGSADLSMRYYCSITKLIDAGIEESGTYISVAFNINRKHQGTHETRITQKAQRP